MKKYILILFLLSISLFSCTQDEDVIPEDNLQELIIPNSILAGDSTSKGLYYQKHSPILELFVTSFNLIDSILIDINSDGTDDFRFTYSISSPFRLGSGFKDFTIKPLNDNKISVVKNDSSLVLNHNLYDVINDSNYWSAYTKILFYNDWSRSGSRTDIGQFYNFEPDNYIGVKVVSDSINYYGWIHIMHTSITSQAISSEYFE
tara:strand:- start:139 stop:750 length:612 start_codon:yes stop_codon:yes gene_type:complete